MIAVHIITPISFIQVMLCSHRRVCFIASVLVCVRLQLILADDVYLLLLSTTVRTSSASPLQHAFADLGYDAFVMKSCKTGLISLTMSVCPCIQKALLDTCFHAGFLSDDMFLRNVA
jgi:hypothetical protein